MVIRAEAVIISGIAGKFVAVVSLPAVTVTCFKKEIVAKRLGVGKSRIDALTVGLGIYSLIDNVIFSCRFAGVIIIGCKRLV